MNVGRALVEGALRDGLRALFVQIALSGRRRAIIDEPRTNTRRDRCGSLFFD
jgi:hypothetical protein